VASAKIVAPAFFSMKDVRTPVYISVVAVAINLLGCILLKGPLQNGGIALAASISAFTNAGLLLLIFNIRFGSLNYKSLWKSILRITTATIVMALPVYLVNHLLTGMQGRSIILQAGYLFGVIVAALFFFMVTLKIIHSQELDELFGLLRRKTPQNNTQK
jgi:putative peptidoglycan lipid II flippase